METQKVQHFQYNIEGETSWRTDITWFQDFYLSNYRDQDCGIGEKANRIIEQSIEPRNTYT